MTRHIEADAAPGQPLANVVRLPEVTATVSTREVVTGRAWVSTRMEGLDDVARAVRESGPVVVTHVAVGTTVDGVPAVRIEGDLTIVPVLEDMIAVEKKLLLGEELHIRRRTFEDAVETPVALRRQRAMVERYDDAGHLCNEEDHR